MKNWVREDLTAQVDGITSTFTLSFPFESGKVFPRINGNTNVQGVIETPPNFITLPAVPKTGFKLVVYYFKNV